MLLHRANLSFQSELLYCKVRILLISALVLVATHLFAQQDYFYAESLIDEGRHAEAVKVLDHLSASGAYADRPRFAMMTLNLAGTTKLYLKDTAGSIQAFTSAMACYDSLTPPRRADDWNKREYYLAGKNLAQVRVSQGEFLQANDLIKKIRYPGHYYSSTGHDVLIAQDLHCMIRARIFCHLNQPDSALSWLRRFRSTEDTKVPHHLDSIFDVQTNFINSVKCVAYTMAESSHRNSFLLFAAWHGEKNTQHSIWFTIPETGKMEIIAHPIHNIDDQQNFPANCYDMSLSPDEKYLAVTCYTEGSNSIDIFSFHEILHERKCILKQTILAYPSSVEIKGWEKRNLLVESDADLTRYNKKTRNNFDVTDNPDVKRLFLFDPESGKFSKH